MYIDGVPYLDIKGDMAGWEFSVERAKFRSKGRAFAVTVALVSLD